MNRFFNSQYRGPSYEQKPFGADLANGGPRVGDSTVSRRLSAYERVGLPPWVGTTDAKMKYNQMNDEKRVANENLKKGSRRCAIMPLE